MQRAACVCRALLQHATNDLACLCMLPFCIAVLQVMQTYARANKLPLDVMRFMTEVTSKTVEQVTEPAAVGCYIHGLVLEGARWVGSRTTCVAASSFYYTNKVWLLPRYDGSHCLASSIWAAGAG